VPAQSVERDVVSPLELFFDLVFVFAVSQLSHHLLDHLTWRGAAETLVLLIAVFGVWSGTSFEATLLHVGRSQTQWMLLAVMLAGLFMNAAIAHAFETGTAGLGFVIPLLLVQAGRSMLIIVAAPTRMLRGHYARLLGWILATAPLWLGGAMVQAASRLLWWAGAAVIDLVGTWLAHPLPGRVLRSENVGFDADHMIERCRLFLLIALGESVLTSGTALTDAPRTLLTLVTGTCALVTIVALWALHFAASDRLLTRYVAATTDPIFAARRTVNGLLVVVACLIAVAVGNELVISHPHGHVSVALSLLLFGGPLLYLGSQTSYRWAVIGTRSLPRLAGIAALWWWQGGLAQLHTRQVRLVGVTDHPNGPWVVQRAREFSMRREAVRTAEPSAPRFLIRDRDSKFTSAFDDVFASDGIQTIKTPVQAPNANAFAERWVRTVREECLDWMLIWGRCHLERVLDEYVRHYNDERPHRSLALRPPRSIEVRAGSDAVTVAARVRRRDRLDGLVHEYYQVAA